MPVRGMMQDVIISLVAYFHVMLSWEREREREREGLLLHSVIK